MCMVIYPSRNIWELDDIQNDLKDGLKYRIIWNIHNTVLVLT